MRSTHADTYRHASLPDVQAEPRKNCDGAAKSKAHRGLTLPTCLEPRFSRREHFFRFTRLLLGGETKEDDYPNVGRALLSYYYFPNGGKLLSLKFKSVSL
jgi:hypothetical protein